MTTAPVSDRAESFRLPSRRIVSIGVVVLLVCGLLGGAYVRWKQYRRVSPMPSVMPMSMGEMPGGLRAEGTGTRFNVPLVESVQDSVLEVDHRLPLQMMVNGPTSEVIAKLPTSLSFAQDPTTGQLLNVTRDGRLLLHDPRNLGASRSLQLDRLAYQMVVDNRRRLLYMATCEASALRLAELGDRNHATGDLSIYDLDAILKHESTESILPVRRLEISGHVTNLLLSADGNDLFYISEGMNSAQIGRIETSTGVEKVSHQLRVPGPTSLSQCADTGKLYALAGSRLYQIDPSSWEIVDQVNINGAVMGIQVARAGQIFLLERGRNIQIKLLDYGERKHVGRWTIDTDGRPYMSLSPDRSTLYVSVSAFTMGRIWGIDVSPGKTERLNLLLQAGSSPEQLLRGGLHVSSDGQHLFLGSGQMFKTNKRG